MFISEVAWFPHIPLVTQSQFLYASKPTVINVSAHLFHPEIGKRNRTCNSCAPRPNSRAGRICGLQRRSRLFAHIHRFKMVNTLTASQIPEPPNVISRLHPKKLVKAMELQGSSGRATFNFTSESSVLGMRTMFSSASKKEVKKKEKKIRRISSSSSSAPSNELCVTISQNLFQQPEPEYT